MKGADGALGADTCSASGKDDALLNMCGFPAYHPADDAAKAVLANTKLTKFYKSYCGPANGAATVLAVAGATPAAFYAADTSAVGTAGGSNDDKLCVGAHQQLFLSSIAVAVSAFVMY